MTALLDLSATLASCAGLGPYFVLEDAGPGPADGPTDWLDLDGLCAPDRVDRLLGATRTALAGSEGVPSRDIDPRAAASSLHLALASRLTSAAVGCAALDRAVPALATTARWRPSATHAVGLGVSVPLGRRAASRVGAADLVREELMPLLDAIGDAVRARSGVSRRVLRGNVSSALRGVVSVLGLQRPDVAPAASAVVGEVLGRAPLADTWSVVDGSFRRTSCCLFYRVPSGHLCGDCVLLSSPARHLPGGPAR